MPYDSNHEVCNPAPTTGSDFYVGKIHASPVGDVHYFTGGSSWLSPGEGTWYHVFRLGKAIFHLSHDRVKKNITLRNENTAGRNFVYTIEYSRPSSGNVERSSFYLFGIATCRVNLDADVIGSMKVQEIRTDA